MADWPDDTACPICGMEFGNEDDMLIHLEDCQAEADEALDADERSQ